MLKHYPSSLVISGCDEAGRGCLAGPVVASAVILDKAFSHPKLNDSKQLSEKDRNMLRIVIEKEAICWAVGYVYPKEIDKINILNASFLAMHKALEQLKTKPTFIIVDGNRFKPYKTTKHECIIKGDAKYLSIAAASILAKTHRDDYMKKLSEEYPQYAWNSNKGYPTKAHREAIRTHGASKFHRKSFRLLPFGEQMDLF